MEAGTILPFAGWENFYVIIGSSAAALTGLQFVVIVLGAELRTGTEHTTSVFATPTIVHFCAVLLNASILSAPWKRVSSAAVAIAVFGAMGVLYMLHILRRARIQTDYTPVLEDWIWHCGLPFLAYVAFVVAAVLLPGAPAPVLFVIGAASLLLLYVGIHNAWDAVTYLAISRRKTRAPEGEGS